MKKQKTYRVTWRFDVDADNPAEAAAMALIVQRDTESVATVFDVSHKKGQVETIVTIDLGEDK